MSQKEINTVGDLAEKVLQKNPERPLSSTYFGIFLFEYEIIVQRISNLGFGLEFMFPKTAWPPGSCLVLLPPLLVGSDAGASLRKTMRWLVRVDDHIHLLKDLFLNIQSSDTAFFFNLAILGRKLEDKLGAVNVETRPFTLNLNTDDLHKNREIPSAFPCHLGVLDTTLPMKGTAHRRVRGTTLEEDATINVFFDTQLNFFLHIAIKFLPT